MMCLESQAMIKASDVLTYHQSRPFEPFDIRTSDGGV